MMEFFFNCIFTMAIQFDTSGMFRQRNLRGGGLLVSLIKVGIFR